MDKVSVNGIPYTVRFCNEMTSWLLGDSIEGCLVGKESEILRFILLESLYLVIDSHEFFHLGTFGEFGSDPVEEVRLDPVPISSTLIGRPFACEQVPQYSSTLVSLNSIKYTF